MAATHGSISPFEAFRRSAANSRYFIIERPSSSSPRAFGHVSEECDRLVGKPLREVPENVDKVLKTTFPVEGVFLVIGIEKIHDNNTTKFRFASIADMMVVAGSDATIMNVLGWKTADGSEDAVKSIMNHIYHNLCHPRPRLPIELCIMKCHTAEADWSCLSAVSVPAGSTVQYVPNHQEHRKSAWKITIPVSSARN